MSTILVTIKALFALGCFMDTQDPATKSYIVTTEMCSDVCAAEKALNRAKAEEKRREDCREQIAKLQEAVK